MLNPVRNELQTAIISELQKKSVQLTDTSSYAKPKLRDTLEFINALKKGCAGGTVNYDTRKPDEGLDSDPEYTLAYMYAITLWIQSISDNITLTVNYRIGDAELSVISNLERELLFVFRKLTEA